VTRASRRRAAGLAAVIAALHVAGFGVLLVLVVPQDLQLGGGAVFGLGLGVTAYTLGMRHAFDADHIGAIDNVTRKLMADGRRPLSVGFFSRSATRRSSSSSPGCSRSASAGSAGRWGTTTRRCTR
jgi:nickel/cobalt transporter (NiCoT) family protein